MIEQSIAGHASQISINRHNRPVDQLFEAHFGHVILFESKGSPESDMQGQREHNSIFRTSRPKLSEPRSVKLTPIASINTPGS